jgi:hypothetical protein
MGERELREGGKSGRRRLERMKLGNGIKGRDDRSSGTEIFMSVSFRQNSFIMNQENER